MVVTAVTGCPVQPDFDPLAPGYLADPFAAWSSLPIEARPLFYAPAIDYYILTRHADIAEVFHDSETHEVAPPRDPGVHGIPGARDGTGDPRPRGRTARRRERRRVLRPGRGIVLPPCRRTRSSR